MGDGVETRGGGPCYLLDEQSEGERRTDAVPATQEGGGRWGEQVKWQKAVREGYGLVR